VVVSALRSIPQDRRELQWLTELVKVGLQLELATIPPYLTAYWSIRDAGHPVARSLFEVVLEEMQHLGLMCNLLAGLGQPVRLRDAALLYPCSLPGGVHSTLTLDLLPFGPISLASFMAVEYPESGDARGSPDGDDKATIGEFYSLLEDGFAMLAPDLGVGRQIEAMGLTKLRDAADIANALQTIKRQGEGSRHSPADSHVGDLSHYYRFREMREGRRFRHDPDAGQWRWAEPIDVPTDDAILPITPARDNDAQTAEAAAALAAFDTAYSGLLTLLEQAWQSGDAGALRASAASMARLGDAAVTVMRLKRPDRAGNYTPRFRPIQTQ